MEYQGLLSGLSLSQYEITAYLSLVANHPVNGSQLSRGSGIPRARIYDVLRSLQVKGLATEIEEGLYVPLPPEELMKRLRHRFESDLSALQEKISAASKTITYDFIWSLRGYAEIIDKAKEMISSAKREIYILAYPKEGHVLVADLKEVESRGVSVRYISMGNPPAEFALQVIHPRAEIIQDHFRSSLFDIVVDKDQLLTGRIDMGNEDGSLFCWTKHQWFVAIIRDYLRHEFYHVLLNKIVKEDVVLSAKEKEIYETLSVEF